MIRVFIMGTILLGAARLTACQTTAEPAPAIVSKTSPDTLKTLSMAVSSALGNRDVVITPAQIEGRTSITVPPLDLARRRGALIDGRSQIRPDHFDIMKAGPRAYLIHRETGKEIELKGVTLKTAVTP